MVQVVESPSVFFDGMVDSRLPVVVAHGEFIHPTRSSESRDFRLFRGICG